MIFMIVESSDTEIFEGRVNEALEDGWKFHGVVMIAYTPRNAAFYAQAFYKDVSKPKSRTVK